MTNFNGAAFQPGRVRQLHQTENFIVNEEITGGMLHKAFGIDQPYMLNTNYAQIFSASNRYFVKPMIGMLAAQEQEETHNLVKQLKFLHLLIVLNFQVVLYKKHVLQLLFVQTRNQV